MAQQRSTRSRQAERAFKQFWDAQQRLVLGGEPMTLKVCNTCCALVPSGDRATARHAEYHLLIQQAIDSALPQ
jgi:hypothetical protein